ncbi:MAG: hypothetical protein P1P65_05980 [Treponema sp.]
MCGSERGNTAAGGIYLSRINSGEKTIRMQVILMNMHCRGTYKVLAMHPFEYFECRSSVFGLADPIVIKKA